MATEEKKPDDRLPVEVRAQMLQKETSIYFNLAKFEHAQRIAALFASSTMVPQHFQGNVANCLIALNYADRLQADPFMVLQNMYVVHGRPGVEAKLVIALINQSGKYSEPLKYKFDGTGDDYGCTAWTREEKSGEVVEGPKVSKRMVTAEGWDKDKKSDKTGYVQKSKWNTMPEMMYRYRAASYFANVHCPELKLGMQTVEEINDFVDLQQTSRGKYAVREEPPPVELPAPDFATVFADELSDPLFTGWFEELITQAAANWKKTVDQARADSIRQHEQIKALFVEHKRKLAAKPETKPEDAKVYTSIKETTPETAAPPADDFRSKWINLKEAGLSTFVFKNIDKFRALEGEALAEAVAKWKKIYTSFPVPFVANSAEPQPQATGEAQGYEITTSSEGTSNVSMETELERLKAEIRMHDRKNRDTVKAAMHDTGITLPTTIDGCRVLLEAIEARIQKR